MIEFHAFNGNTGGKDPAHKSWFVLMLSPKFTPLPLSPAHFILFLSLLIRNAVGAIKDSKARDCWKQRLGSLG